MTVINKDDVWTKELLVYKPKERRNDLTDDYETIMLLLRDHKEYDLKDTWQITISVGDFKGV